MIPEHTDAADEPRAFTERLAAVVAAELAGLRSLSADERLAARLERYRRIGLP